MDGLDRWVWGVDMDGQFSVNAVRKHIDSFVLPDGGFSVRWLKCLPIKVNIFAWRIRWNRLPTRMNLETRGVDVESIMCPCCGESGEEVNHLFVSCVMAKQLWDRLARWIEVEIPAFSSVEEMWNWVDTQPIVRRRRVIVTFLFHLLTSLL